MSSLQAAIGSRPTPSPTMTPTPNPKAAYMSSLEAAVVGSIALFTLRSITCHRSGHTLRQQALGVRLRHGS